MPQLRNNDRNTLKHKILLFKMFAIDAKCSFVIVNVTKFMLCLPTITHDNQITKNKNLLLIIKHEKRNKLKLVQYKVVTIKHAPFNIKYYQMEKF